MQRIDLHIHTNMSDGSFTPKEVIDEAHQNGVSILAIADHDTIEAYTEELFKYAESKNVMLIPAVEISTKIEKAGIHVLGYHFDWKDSTLKEELAKLRNIRHDYLHEVAKKLEELGYCLNMESLDTIDAVTKAHIALDIVTNPQNKKILMQEFGYIPSKEEFIETIMNENCPAYVKKRTVSPKEAADMIRKANGKVVLAHPVAYAQEDGLTEADMIEIIKDMEPDGLEANYLYVDRNNNTIDETKKWNKFAKEQHLFPTIGSDFHAKDGIRPEIGLVNTNIILTEEEIENMIQHILG